VTTPFDDLLELAGLDSERIALEHSRGVLPARVSLDALRDRFAEIERARQLLEPERAPLASSLAALEVEVGHLAERRAQVEGRLAAATGGGRELAAMHTEARHLVEKMGELEDQELELMEALEPLETRLGALRAEAAPMVAERDTLLAQLADQEAALVATLEAQRAARAEVAGRLEAGLLARYERIAAREGTGAARLEHGTCGGCHLSLSSSEVDRLRHLPADELSSCDQCERFLVRPDQLSS